MARPTYVPEQFETDGFIHCTDGEANLIAVGNRYYIDDLREMVCLVIDVSKVTSLVKYEDEQRIFPHIYGRLNCDAVIGARAVMRDDSGKFVRLDPEGI